jgi:hypothetical protein
MAAAKRMALIAATRAINGVTALLVAYPAFTAGVACAAIGSSAAFSLAVLWWALAALLGAR